MCIAKVIKKVSPKSFYNFGISSEIMDNYKFFNKEILTVVLKDV